MNSCIEPPPRVPAYSNWDLLPPVIDEPPDMCFMSIVAITLQMDIIVILISEETANSIDSSPLLKKFFYIWNVDGL